ncbi:MAG: hypothetical protein ACKPE3_22040 [Sphaerospermopsis kisseleviana]
MTQDGLKVRNQGITRITPKKRDRISAFAKKWGISKFQALDIVVEAGLEQLKDIKSVEEFADTEYPERPRRVAA